MNYLKYVAQILLCATFLLGVQACGAKKGSNTTANTETSNAEIEEVQDETNHNHEDVSLTVYQPTPINSGEFKEHFLELLVADELSETQQTLLNKLLSLDNSSISALCNANLLLSNLLNNYTPEQADKLVKVYRAYAYTHLSFVRIDSYYTQVSDNFFNAYDDLDHIPQAYHPILNGLKDCGIQLEDVGEGIAEYHFQPNYVYELFKGKVSEATAKFLSLEAYERKRPFVFDAAVCTTQSDLADRTVAFEQFLDKYRDSEYAYIAQNIFDSNIYMLLNGLDNTPVFDHWNEEMQIGELSTASYDVLKRIIKNHRGTKVARILESFCRVVKKNNMQRSQEVEDFLSKYNPDDFQLLQSSFSTFVIP